MVAWTVVGFWYYYYDFLKPHLRTCLLILERGERWERERERNIDVREEHWLLASCMCPNWGINPQPRHVPWPGIKPMTFWFTGPHQPGWVLIFFFLSIFYWLCYHSFPNILPLIPLPPCPPQLSSIPLPLSSCPWVVHISSLSPLFPMPFFISPCLLYGY